MRLVPVTVVMPIGSAASAGGPLGECLCGRSSRSLPPESRPRPGRGHVRLRDRQQGRHARRRRRVHRGDDDAGTVGDLLPSKGITVGDQDVVAPALDAKVTDGTRIAVQFGRQVTVERRRQGRRRSGPPRPVSTRRWRARASTPPAPRSSTSPQHRASAGRASASTSPRSKTITVKAAGKQAIKTTAQTVADVLDRGQDHRRRRRPGQRRPHGAAGRRRDRSPTPRST